MVKIDHTLGNISQVQIDKDIVKVMFEWFECDKGRIMKTAEDGIELGIAIAGGIKRGAVLLDDDEKIYVADISPCRLIEIKTDSIEKAARAGFELGNRHLSLKVEERRILVPYDRPTFEYLQKFDFEVNETLGIFEEYTVCKAHGHSHHG